MSKKLFYILLFLLPVNLGKHFIFNFSYVNGILVDYLIPTIFVQDVLIFSILCTWRFARRSMFLPIVVFFLFSVFLSTLVSNHFYLAFYGFIRYALYFGFFLYVLSEFDLANDLKISLKLLILSGVFVSLLAIAQTFLQHSVFNNYLVFGEQPYSYATFGITKKLLFGQAFIPPYSLFRHPNILAGYVSIIFFLNLFYVKKFDRRYIFFAFLFFITILLTLSKVAVVSVILGTGLLALSRFKALFIITLSLAILSGLLFTIKAGEPSIYRRASLVYTAYKIIQDKPFYGVGLNNFVFYNRTAFMQPVHNIFLLGIAEQGFIAFGFLVYLLFLAIKKLLHNMDLLGATLLVCLFQIIFIGSFDHYFLTIHQTFLLFLLTLALSLKYNSNK